MMTSPIRNHLILLVEDNPDDVLLIQRAFQHARIANPLQIVSDGEAAIAYLSGKTDLADRLRHPLPALILLDLKLPRVSGLEVLEWMRKREGLKRLPVVVLTSSNQISDVNRAYDLGANSYLVKPVAPEGLFSLMQTLQVYWMILNEPPEVGR